MGTITTGTGLISGIDTKSLIDQLMQIEARPQTLVKQQVTLLKTQQTAIQEVNAKLLSFKLSVSSLGEAKTFRSTAASSSNADVLTASTSNSAVPGTYNFTVSRLVSSQQTVTRGFTDSSATGMGAAATLKFSFGDAAVTTDQNLSDLNGGEGVSRGKIRITDRSGATSLVDLSTAVTVNDVLDRINAASGINVTASIDGDSLKITDNTGLTTANLSISNVGTTNTATSLGLAGSVAAGSVTGSAIRTVSRESLLTTLNDRGGVRTSTLDDFSVTVGATSFNVNLADTDTTLGHVIDAINAAANTAGLGDIADINDNGTGLKIDAGAGNGPVSVAALNSSLAASDLGILGSTAGDTLVGDRVIGTLNSKLLGSLRGGYAGGADTLLQAGTVRFQTGSATDVDLSAVRSVDQLVSAINAAGAGVTASINEAGNGVVITRDGGGSLEVTDVSGNLASFLQISGAHADGVAESGDLEVRTVSEATLLSALNGGKGITRGKFTLTDGNGVSATVDLTQGNEITVGDVLDEINSKGLAVVARVNDSGDGILISPTAGASAIKVEEQGSSTAKDLGILGEASAAGESLNGSFDKTVSIEAADTLEDVRDKINDAGISIRATIINDGSATNPYRLSLASANSGRSGAFVFDDGGLDLRATQLSNAQDALVFFGSSDPAKAVAIVSSTNSLNNLIAGATVSLKNTSASPVELVISRDDDAVIKAMQGVVTGFNSIVEAINKYDKYDTETKTKGLLLGDSTLARVRTVLFKFVNTVSTEVTGTYRSMSQVGFSVGSDSKLALDETKFRKAFDSDATAVEQLFSLKEYTLDSDGKKTSTVARGGIGVRFDLALDALTNTTNGLFKNVNDSYTSRIEAGNDRIALYDDLIAAKRSRLETQYANMEKVLAQLQSQNSALASLSTSG